MRQRVVVKNERPVMPILYFYRGRGRSDRNWIRPRMAAIPESEQAAVAAEYERLFLQKGRNAANEFLRDTAIKHRGNGQNG